MFVRPAFVLGIALSFAAWAQAADGPAAPAASAWPSFRGPLSTGAVASLPATLPATLQPVWKKDLKGKAFSGVVTDGQRVVVTDWVEGKQDVVRCFSADKGEEVWTATWGNDDKEMDWTSAPRATPTIADGKVYVLGAGGEIQALALTDGKPAWTKHLVKDLKGQLPTWGYCASPLVADGKVIVTPGGAQTSVVALDAATGKQLWAVKGGGANYASPILATVGGKKQAIVYDDENVRGIDVATGAVVWTKALPANSGYVVPSPVVVGDLLVACADHGASAMTLSKAQGKQPDEWTIEDDDFLLDNSSPIVVDRLVVGCVMGKGVVALDTADGLKPVAACEKPDDLQDFGNLIAGNGRLLVMTQPGTLELLALEGTKCTRVAGAKLCGETMAAPALVGSKFFVRDEKAVYCFDLAGGK